jgi:hypothetical protein
MSNDFSSAPPPPLPFPALTTCSGFLHERDEGIGVTQGNERARVYNEVPRAADLNPILDEYHLLGVHVHCLGIGDCGLGV